MTGKTRVPPVPPDQGERDRIVRDLDRNMLVEAAAGTGKTTSIVERMVKLLDLKLDVHSEPGNGSVFALELPLSNT